jgi:hypothetical protein
MRPPAPALKSSSVFQIFGQFVLRIPLLLALVAISSASSYAQTTPRRALITQPVEESRLTVLRGNTYPLARAEYDRGAAPPSLPMDRMLLVLKRAPELETALDALLDQQQDKSSPNFHAWLTPAQFGQQFGPADQDIQTVTSWLQLQGFQVATVSNGRTVIEFSGTAAQVQTAFHTEIHKYSVKNEDHWANSTDPQIPTALTPAVAGVLTLHNFPRHAMNHVVGTFKRTKGTSALTPAGPLFTLPGFFGQDTAYGVGPYDFATIYNVSPLWNATPAINGTGQTIAIVGETDVDIIDLQKFRALFGITSNDPVMIVDGPDPGLQPDEIESDLDLEWSSAVAPGAAIKFVVAATTDTTLGVDLAAQYIVDHNLAPVVSESYGICEAALGTAGNQFFNQLWQQAAAQGMSVFLASGDSGSAGCDRDDPAQFGLQVSGFASTPYTTTVGGTDFNDPNNPETYFNPTNDAHQASAKSYIPEMTWNDSCTNAEFSMFTGNSNAETNCNNPQLINTVAATGGSGGKSSCTTGDGQDIVSCSGGYAKPSWQTGTGVPNDGKRDIPDVSLFASNGFNGNFYVICSRNITGFYCDGANPNGTVVGIGGTSASAPAFAGIMALIDQKTNSRQGNPNYLLYKLAAQQPASGCNSSTPPPGTCVFNDVTNGTIAMPCFTGSTIDCHTAVNGDQFGVLTGYATGVGYDRATGLGTVNAANLVSAWVTAAGASKGSATTLSITPSPMNIPHGATSNVTISVAAAPGGTGTPGGEVSLVTSTGMGAGSFLLTNGSATGSIVDLPGGTYTVTAHYPGDATFGASDSTAVSAKVTPEASKATIAYELFDPITGNLTNPNATTATFGGSPSLLRINVTSQAGDACAGNTQGASGCPTGTVTLTDNTKPLDGGTFALNSNGYAEDQLIDLPGGVHNLKVIYAGDNSYAALAPFTDVVTINAVPTTISLSVDFPTVIVGSSTSLTIQMSVSNIYSNIAPSGTLTILDGTTVLSTFTAPGELNPTTHQASIGVSTGAGPFTMLGHRVVTVKYSGDGSYSASVSNPVTINVVLESTTSLTSSSPTIMTGQSVTFTAKVAPTSPGGPTATGTVQFLGNNVSLGAPVALVNGQAQFTTTSLPFGAELIQAFYSGDSNYGTSSQGVEETINPYTSTTMVVASSSTPQSGQNATFTATVVGTPSGGPTPTGTVGFLVNGGGTGTGATLNPAGQAVFSSTTLPLGSVTVTAIYNGDGAHTTSQGTTTVTVTAAPDFSVAANPTTITIARPGQSGSTSLTLTAMNGLTGTLTLTPQCTGLPSQSSCSVSPTSVTFSSTTTTATAMLTVSTIAPSSAVPVRRVLPTGKQPGLIVGLSLLALISMLAALRKRRSLEFALSLLAFATLLTFAACGGGGGGGGGGGNPGTPIGLDQNAKVTFVLGNTTHAVTLSVNVE